MSGYIAGETVRKWHVSSQLSINRLHLVHKDQLLLIECRLADVSRTKLLQASNTEGHRDVEVCVCVCVPFNWAQSQDRKC